MTEPSRAADRERAGDEGPQAPVLVDDDPRGTLRLEGQVLDADDHPAANVTVILGSHPPRRVQTEADGGFAFDQLVGRPYTLAARGAKGIAGPITAKLTDRSDPVVLHLRPAARVTVGVTGPDASPLEGATVELRGPDGLDEQHATTTAGTATFTSVVPGGYQIAAWDEHLARTFDWVQVGPGETTARLRLAAGAPVTGRVVDEQGAGIAGARVTFHGASDWSQQADSRFDAAVSEKDGTFRFDALPAGSFRFVAKHDALAAGISQLVTLDGKTERSGLTIQLAAGATVRGKVVDGTQQPVASARVRIGIVSKRGMVFSPPRQAFTDARGNFEIRGLARRELAAVAMHETGASATQAVDTTRGDVDNVVLTLDVTGTIAGIVVDPTGQPIEGAQVSAGPNFRDPGAADFSQFQLRGYPSELTDAGGKFTLVGLSPGTYSITALREQAASRGRSGATQGVIAKTGTRDLKITLEPEGGVRGKVLFADGSAPEAFTIQVGFAQQSFLATSEFVLDDLPPQKYDLAVRGPSMRATAMPVTVPPGKIVDVGTITVSRGRVLAGMVVADGQPVANATVYAGRMVFGNGTSAATSMGPMGAPPKQATTGPDGSFSLAGFNDGDIAITAERADIGRSKPLRIPTELPGQGQLVLELQKFGSLRGVLRSGGAPAEGVIVSCQSTTTPGALYGVASGPDGGYRYDRLAPDTYKVSATIGMPMTGMTFYSKEVTVLPGKEAVVDLSVEPGTVTLDVTAVPKSGKLGVASAWVASGVFSARTATDLQLRIAAAGPGNSHWLIIRAGEAASFGEMAPGTYTACVVPFPSEVQGMAAMGYSERHGDQLPAFCQPVTLAAAPAKQQVSVPVEIPPFVSDGAGSGSGG